MLSVAEYGKRRASGKTAVAHERPFVAQKKAAAPVPGRPHTSPE